MYNNREENCLTTRKDILSICHSFKEYQIPKVISILILAPGSKISAVAFRFQWMFTSFVEWERKPFLWNVVDVLLYVWLREPLLMIGTVSSPMIPYCLLLSFYVSFFFILFYFFTKKVRVIYLPFVPECPPLRFDRLDPRASQILVSERSKFPKLVGDGNSYFLAYWRTNGERELS